MFSWLAIREACKLFFSGILKKISLKGVLIFLVLCAAAFGVYQVYKLGESHQATKDNAQITKLQNDLAQKKQELTSLRGQVTDWENKAKTAQDKFAGLQKDVNHQIQQGIAKANARAAHWEKVASHKKEIVKYVTSQADAHCVIPNGFVQLFNQSATAGPDGSNYLPGSLGLYVDAPSGYSLSDIAQASIINNAHAVQLRQEVIEWQTWYKSTKANWEKVQQIIQSTAPNLNPPKPPTKSPTVTTNAVTLFGAGVG